MGGFDSRGRNTSRSPWDCVKSERRYFNLGILMRDFDEERDPIEVQHVQPCRRFDLPLYPSGSTRKKRRRRGGMRGEEATLGRAFTSGRIATRASRGTPRPARRDGLDVTPRLAARLDVAARRRPWRARDVIAVSGSRSRSASRRRARARARPARPAIGRRRVPSPRPRDARRRRRARGERGEPGSRARRRDSDRRRGGAHAAPAPRRAPSGDGGVRGGRRGGRRRRV